VAIEEEKSQEQGEIGVLGQLAHVYNAAGGLVVECRPL
jgi:hypothetical protein